MKRFTRNDDQQGIDKIRFETEDRCPQGWVKTTIADLGFLVTKGSTPTSYGFRYVPSGINFVKIENIRHSHIETNSIKQFITKETHDYLKRSQLHADDILFSIAGTIGKVAIVHCDDLPANTNQAISIIRNSRKLINTKYLSVILQSKSLNILSKARGVGIYNVSLEDIKNMNILLPPLPEQYRIVSKIESIFAQIDAAKQQLERLASQVTSSSGSLAQLKSSVLKQAFDGNLTSQDSDNKYDANEWIVAKLEDITLFSKNGFTGRPNENNSGIPRLGIETITNSNSVFINTSKCKFIDIPSHRLDNYLAQKNDLFFCRQNGNKNYVGKCCIFIDNVRDTIFSDSLILFRIDCNKIYPNYLAYFVNSASGRNQIERYCSTTAGNYSINGTNLKKILIKFPSITEQKKIVAKIESIFGKIDAEFVILKITYSVMIFVFLHLYARTAVFFDYLDPCSISSKHGSK